ncbi:MAG: protein tyrosine phosphatase, partial [Methylacidiphilales bacterium]|nr:protein tyrosine phosphatase [Candidatus Methylacidiphilales bacterium]
MIHVCSLARLHHTVAATGARHMVTLINAATPVPRPATIAETNHLFIGINDIVEDMPGFVAPGEAHVARLIAFVRAWHAARDAPLVVHCWAGISRSTAQPSPPSARWRPAATSSRSPGLRAASPTA